MTGTEWYMTKKGLDVLKLVCTKSNVQWMMRLYNKHLVKPAEHFAEYKKLAQDDYGIVSNSVLGNRQRSMAEVYVPQYIVDERDNTEYLIKDYPSSIIRKYRRIVIKDYAGRGKSTLMKKMFLGAIAEGEFPLFVELRNLNGGGTIMEEILKSLQEINKVFEEYLLRYMLDQGIFVIFLDGFDEVNNERRADVAKDIKKFVDQARNNLFVMTSRNDDVVKSFGSFYGFMIKDFTIEQACDLILRYDEKGMVSQQLVAELRDGKHKEVFDFLRSPLHASLFYKVFKDKREVPYKLHEVCAEIYSHLYNMHDLMKDGVYEHQKKCNLSEQDYAKVLGYIAMLCLKKKSIFICKAELDCFFDMVKQHYADIQFENDDMRYDMVVSLSLFKEDGSDVIWIHEAMCHYFASCYVRMDNVQREVVLGNLYKSRDISCYAAMIKMYSEMEPVEFRKYMLTALLNDMESKYVNELAYGNAGIELDSKFVRCYLLFGHKLEYDSGDGKVTFYKENKNVLFLVQMMYSLCTENYKVIRRVHGVPTGWGMDECHRKRFKINSFSELQDTYDYANEVAVQEVGWNGAFLDFEAINVLKGEFMNEELISENVDLLQNI